MKFPKGKLAIEREIEKLRADNEKLELDCEAIMKSADRFLEDHRERVREIRDRAAM